MYDIRLKNYNHDNIRINFLSWYIFIYNINDKLSDIDINNISFDFEIYGYIKYSNDCKPMSNFIINDYTDILYRRDEMSEIRGI